MNPRAPVPSVTPRAGLPGARRPDGAEKPFAGIPEIPEIPEIPLPPAAVDSADFRRVMSTFPSVVSVITAFDDQGVPRGLTCSAFCSLSMEPPTMLVCINRRNGSLAAVRASGGFALHLLTADSAWISDRFASSSADKFAGIRWRRSPVGGLPHLRTGVLAVVDCRVVADVTAGTHAVLVGLVVDCRTEADAGTADGTPIMRPLVYWQRSYGSWAAATGAEEHGGHEHERRAG